MSGPRSLASMQQAFAQCLIDGTRDPGPGLVRERGLSARQRLDVYRHNTRIVQGDALEAIYPAVRRLVGEEFFANMAVLYGDRHPSRHGDLRRFGAHLAEFIEAFEPLAAYAYLPDVARLEWACHEALHAPTRNGEPPRTGGAQRLAPHVRLPRSPFPVARIWEYALGEHGPDTPRLDIEGLGPDHLLVMRPRLNVQVLAVDPAQWHWLARFRDGPRVPQAADVQRVRLWRSRGVLEPA